MYFRHTLRPPALFMRVQQILVAIKFCPVARLVTSSFVTVELPALSD
jgi:hypothetical protein